MNMSEIRKQICWFPLPVLLLLVFQGIIIFLPETIWGFIDLEKMLQKSPDFITPFVKKTSFPKAMYLFWVCSPLFFFISTVAMIWKVNVTEYQAFLCRRKSLIASGQHRYFLTIGGICFLSGYIFALNITDGEFRALIFNFSKNKFLFFLCFAGGHVLAFPLSIAALIAELRANLTKSPGEK
jgi:hypothetical protein